MDAAWAGYGDTYPLSIAGRFLDNAYYSTAEVGIIARCSTEHVRRACRNGTLDARQSRERGHWVVRGEDGRAWANRGCPSGQ
jgi:hypothetical protein